MKVNYIYLLDGILFKIKFNNKIIDIGFYTDPDSKRVTSFFPKSGSNEFRDNIYTWLI